MSEHIESIVANAVSEAGIAADSPSEPTLSTETSDPSSDPIDASGTEGDASPTQGEGGDSSPVGAETTHPPDADASNTESIDAKGAENTDKPVDEDTKFLESIGLRDPKPGERENRIPHKRVKQMVMKGMARAKEQVEAGYKTQLAERDTKLATMTTRSDFLTKLEQASDADAMKFVEMAAIANPKVWAPIVERLKGAVSPQTQSQPQVSAAGPRPEPDVQFTDGSKGYSPAQHDKLLAWVASDASAKATAAATKQFDDRFGPIEKQYKAQEINRQLAPQVQARIEQMRTVYGEAFTADEKKGTNSEILAYQKANPSASFEAACAAVLVPKLRADEVKIREKIAKEARDRKPAAKSQAAAPAKAVRQPSDEPRTTEDVVRQSLIDAGMLS
jgi:hypothetical protein